MQSTIVVQPGNIQNEIALGELRKIPDMTLQVGMHSKGLESKPPLMTEPTHLEGLAEIRIFVSDELRRREQYRRSLIDKENKRRKEFDLPLLDYDGNEIVPQNVRRFGKSRGGNHAIAVAVMGD